MIRFNKHEVIWLSNYCALYDQSILNFPKIVHIIRTCGENGIPATCGKGVVCPVWKACRVLLDLVSFRLVNGKRAMTAMNWRSSAMKLKKPPLGPQLPSTLLQMCEDILISRSGSVIIGDVHCSYSLIIRGHSSAGSTPLSIVLPQI